MTYRLDVSTRQAVKYWRSKGVDIRPWIYRVYSLDGQMYLDINAFGRADDPYEDKPTQYHLINTNYSNDPVSHDYMLDQRRAAAFYGDWKYKIDNIEPNDRVFLYRSGEGIVAFGVCKSSNPGVKNPPHGPEDTDEEHFVELEPFHVLPQPLSAARLREAAEYHVPLVSTYTSIRSEGGELLWQECLKHI
ncbi:EVE domain-containing protein [Arhodomonas aquaeolei]|uniref:EVE domain-containing protein n=1 Tax=Arhodomonas aquaeolei TaxID=2369 RepID=UPI0021699CA7|nr:EVE domain-containing protein [Arhodomonas aquaeolei]MCS4504304.1 EVE domain-containing protein [Arhodomonas aquaeolei]